MNYIKAILASVFCVGAPMAQVENMDKKIEWMFSSDKLAKDTVSSIRQAYENGQYDSFLLQMDVSYEQDYVDSGLEGLIQMRQDAPPSHDLFEYKFQEIQDQRNQSLSSVISDDDQSIMAEKVRTIITNFTTPSEKNAIDKLNSYLYKAPYSGVNDDENRLIDIDLEFEYKLLHAKLPQSDVSPNQIQEHLIVLKMAKMDKMVKASELFTDESLKNAVKLASIHFDDRLAQSLELADLNKQIRANENPKSELEAKVFAIIKMYQEDLKTLIESN